MEEECLASRETCTMALQAVNDALYAVNGKWKLPIMIVLRNGNRRFGQLAKELPRITDKMLSKELRELEINQLIKRTVHDTVPAVVEYSLTEYGYSLDSVIKELKIWGQEHRRRIMSN